jgi:hypothetical protein
MHEVNKILTIVFLQLTLGIVGMYISCLINYMPRRRKIS